MSSITYQDELRPVLSTIFGAKDYRKFRQTLEEMDHILTDSNRNRTLRGHTKNTGEKFSSLHTAATKPVSPILASPSVLHSPWDYRTFLPKKVPKNCSTGRRPCASMKYLQIQPA
jgi:hypothetical protein